MYPRFGEQDRFRRRQQLAVAVLCVWGFFYASTSAIAAANAATHTVVIEGTQYTPDTMTLKRGDTVVWVNKDPFPHTVTAKGVFDSHEIAPNASWKHVARKSGVYSYICTLHPNMNGTLKVE